ncbi:hypothetical protein AX774_g6981 [Zancudomyces culisetae]|uniref:DUF952 domain-containing protein n=1 Tax=Zancudomyces culisetae TaxID=1213189 RepID=A0A1R1PFG3_ZANCU|nr:hypothetical protein AX774_g6981 [Zancudomyces culisetae]|eukprot:OMH79602.1 hypothetical protein AX774_g6981 [Zancudomyces culisetae]
MEHPNLVYKIVDTNLINLQIAEQPLSQLDAKDGFIHLSTARQTQNTLLRYFQAHSQVTVLKIDLHAVRDQVKWEQVNLVDSDGNHVVEDFPHIYGPLRTEYISEVAFVHKVVDKKDNSSRWIFPTNFLM